MPDRETLERAEEDKREGKSPNTQAGEFRGPGHLPDAQPGSGAAGTVSAASSRSLP